MTKQRLTDERVFENDSLDNIFNNKKKVLNLTQATLAEKMGVSQGAIYQYLKGINPLNAHIATQFARELQVNIDDFSERLANEIREMAEFVKISGNVSSNQNNGNAPQNNVVGQLSIGNQNTNNFFSEETSTEEAKAILGDKEAVFLTAMPELSIDDGVEYALNPAEKGAQIRASMQRSETFIPNSDMTFRIKIAEPILSGISPTPIVQNDILVIEPRIPPRNQDLVLVCLDYQQPMQRGMIARLTIGTNRSLFIKHSDEPAEPLPENALICGVVSDIQRHMLPPDLVAARIDTKWNILDTLQSSNDINQ